MFGGQVKRILELLFSESKKAREGWYIGCGTQAKFSGLKKKCGWGGQISSLGQTMEEYTGSLDIQQGCRCSPEGPMYSCRQNTCWSKPKRWLWYRQQWSDQAWASDAILGLDLAGWRKTRIRWSRVLIREDGHQRSIWQFWVWSRVVWMMKKLFFDRLSHWLWKLQYR